MLGLPKYNYKNSQIIKTTNRRESITSTTDLTELALTSLWSMRTKVASAQLIMKGNPGLGTCR